VTNDKRLAMNYRRLGDAGVKLSEIGLGGWLTFGNALEQAQGRAVMDRAFDLGINFFDTANAYGRGRCESMWGELLAGRRRDGYVLATKVFFPMADGPNDRGLSRKHITEQCHASLRRLRTDYVDLYQCHRFDPDTPLEESVRAIDDLIRQGKVLYWGFSEWTAPQIEQCLRVCSEGGYVKPRGSQPQYSLIHRAIEREVMPLCKTAGIGQVVWSPLGQGILTGKYKPGQPLPADSRARDDRQNMFIKDRLNDRALLEKVQRLVPIAEAKRCSLSQLALAWVLRRSEVTSCIVGASRPEQLEENVKASGVQLDAATVRQVEEILS
jgi:voltage-dependent potassium channel beta subunit